MVSGIRLCVHRRDTKSSVLIGSDSRSVHMKKIMFGIICLGILMVYLFISGKA